MVFIDFSKIDYNCPNCGKKHEDAEDKLCERLNKAKEGFLKLKCDECKKYYGYTVDMTGTAQAFKFDDYRMAKRAQK